MTIEFDESVTCKITRRELRRLLNECRDESDPGVELTGVLDSLEEALQELEFENGVS